MVCLASPAAWGGGVSTELLRGWEKLAQTSESLDAERWAVMLQRLLLGGLVPRGSLHLSGNPGHNIRKIPVSQHRQATSFISLIYSFILYLLSIYYVSCSRLTSPLGDPTRTQASNDPSL